MVVKPNLICTFLNYNIWNSIMISLKFVPRGPINNSPVLVQMMVWRRPEQDRSLFTIRYNATHIYIYKHIFHTDLLVTSHYRNQWWLVYWRKNGSLGLNESTTEIAAPRCMSREVELVIRYLNSPISRGLDAVKALSTRNLWPQVKAVHTFYLYAWIVTS